MISQCRFALLAICFEFLAVISSAAGDTFTLNLHNLAGDPLVSTNGLPNVVKVYRQTQEVRVDDRSLSVASEVSKLGTPLKVGREKGSQIILDVPLDVPVGDDRAVIFVVQRFDEVIPTAALQYVIVSLNNSATPTLDIAVPLATYRAPGPPDASHSPTTCFRKCHKLLHRRCRSR